MRYLAAGLVLGVATIASADPILPESAYEWRKPNTSGAFIDVGAGWMRVDPDGMTYRARYVRFAPQVTIHHWFYVGAAFEVGDIYSSYGQMNGMIPTQCSGNSHQADGCHGGSNLYDQTSGTIIEPQFFFGVRDLVGIVSGAFEVAPTVRWTSSAFSWLNQTFTTTEKTVELHARVDVWATPHFSTGLMVGSQYDTLHDLQVGLQIGFHMEPYDLMTRGH
ncbi:MAG TPA: hypothetical protein VIV58_18515 [Kofleriaceae bacterium]